MTEQRIGEVVEASSGGFTAQCYELYGAPSLGSLVKAGQGPCVYGVVGQVRTEGTDPSRRPVARGAEETEEAGVYASNPQLERLLRTDFEALVVGFEEGDEVRQYLPPTPPRIHAFVYVCSDEEVRRFTGSLGFVEGLLGGGASDDAVAACLRRASLAHEEPEEFLLRAGKELAGLLAGQLPRLQGILRRLEG